MKASNALLVATYPLPRPAVGPQARSRGSPATPRRSRIDIAARLDLDISVQQTAYLVGSVGDARRHLQLHRAARRRPDRAGARVGPRPHQHAVVPILGEVTLQHADLPAAARPRCARSSSAGWPTRSIPTSTPAATTRGSSPAPPSSPTTPSAWRSTSTCPATSAAPSARWTARSCRSSRRGASPGAATGATPTRCTSRPTRSSTRRPGLTGEPSRHVHALVHARRPGRHHHRTRRLVVREVDEPVPGARRRARRRACVRRLVPGPAAEQGDVPAPARAAVHDRDRRGRHRRQRARAPARAAGGRGGAVRRRGRARRRTSRLDVPAPGRALVRPGRGPADELPHRALRPAGARRNAGGRDRARARRGRGCRYGDRPGRRRVRRRRWSP